MCVCVLTTDEVAEEMCQVSLRAEVLYMFEPSHYLYIRAKYLYLHVTNIALTLPQHFPNIALTLLTLPQHFT